LPRRLSAAQAFIDALTYNHVAQPSTFFSVDKRRPLGRILETARCIERDALPIKCVEAVFLALRLTSEWRDVDRVPAAFKTAVAFTDGAGKRRRRCHRHIVLLIRRRRERATDASERSVGVGVGSANAEPTDRSEFGALGISRRASLAHRPMRYGSVSEILTSYREAYEDIGHAVLKVRVGLPAPREPPEAEVCWRHCCVTVGRVSDARGGARERAQEEDADDDDDDDDDDDAEGAASKDEKDPAATWKEAMEIFEAHDAASRSRKAFDKWRVDGERFAYVVPAKGKGKGNVPAKGGVPAKGTPPPDAGGARRRRTARASPGWDGGGKTRRRSSDARRRLKRNRVVSRAGYTRRRRRHRRGDGWRTLGGTREVARRGGERGTAGRAVTARFFFSFEVVGKRPETFRGESSTVRGDAAAVDFWAPDGKKIGCPSVLVDACGGLSPSSARVLLF